MKTLAAQTNRTLNKKYNGAPCAYFDGVFDYFNKNQEAYHAKFTGQKWNGPCVIINLNQAENITYHIGLEGSIASYQWLLSRSME